MAGLGFAVGKRLDPAQATQGGDTGGTEFFGLVSKLLGGLSPGSETDEVWAGQQVSRTKKDKAAEGEPAANVQLEHLLGSMGVIPELANASPGLTEAPNAMLLSGTANPGLLWEVRDGTSRPITGLPVEDQAGVVAGTQDAGCEVQSEETPHSAFRHPEPIEGPHSASGSAEVNPAPSQIEAVVTEAPAARVEVSAGSADVVERLAGREAAVTEAAARPADVAQQEPLQAEANVARPADVSGDKATPAGSRRDAVFGTRPEMMEEGGGTPAQTPEIQAAMANQSGSAYGDGANLLFSRGEEPVNATERPHRAAPEPVADSGKGFEIPSQQVPPQQLREFRAVEAAANSTPMGRDLTSRPNIDTKMIHQIVRAAKVNLFPGGGDMTLRLDPPHLGAVQMNVTVAEGTVTASIQASTESARQILDSNLPNLRQALSEAGVNVDLISVSVNAESNHDWNYQAGTFGGSSHGHSGKGGSVEEDGFGISDAEPSLDDLLSWSSTGSVDFLA